MKKPKLFIPILKDDKKSHQMISVKRMKRISELIPTISELKAHLDIEKNLVETVEKYRPKPYITTLEEKEYNKVLSEVKNKVPAYNKEKIVLMASSESAPIFEIRKEVSE